MDGGKGQLEKQLAAVYVQGICDQVLFRFGKAPRGIGLACLRGGGRGGGVLKRIRIRKLFFFELTSRRIQEHFRTTVNGAYCREEKKL